MIFEIGVGALFAFSGFGVLATVRRDVQAVARVWLSIPIGIALYLFAALALVTVTGTLAPPLVLGLAVALGSVGYSVAGIRGDLRFSELKWAAAAIGIALITVVMARLFHLTRLSPDSLRYLLGASDLVRPDALAEFNRADLLNRQIGLPSLQALSELVDRRYVASVSPLFGISGVGLFTWLSWNLTSNVHLRRRTWLTASAIAFLGTTNRLVFDSFYINAHIEVAVFLLIAVAGTWLAVSAGGSGWALPAGLAIAATLLLRPESPIVVAIVLISVAASRADWPIRLALALPVVAVTSIWYGVVLWNHANGGDEIALTAPVFGGLVAVMGSVVMLLAGGYQVLRAFVSNLDWVMLLAMTLLLIGLGAADPDVVIDSFQAALRNLTGDGMWMLTWVAAIPLLGIALVVRQVPDARLWTIPILGFGVLWWLLPLIRGGAWRVGAGDSGNRILAHILPSLVLFLVLAAVRPTFEE